jgi:hypothetical protein
LARHQFSILPISDFITAVTGLACAGLYFAVEFGKKLTTLNLGLPAGKVVVYGKGVVGFWL